MLDAVRLLLRHEVLDEPVPARTLCGLSEAELRRRSHFPQEFYGQPHFMPAVTDSPALLQLNRARCAARAAELPHVRFRGLMAIPPAAAAPGENRPWFRAMRQLYIDIREKMSDNQSDITYLSMGMSGDYADAIAEGSTLIRVGTALFGPRPPMWARG